MYAKRQIIYTTLALVFFFLIGWKTSEYYFVTNYIPEQQTFTYEESEETPLIDNPQAVDMSLFWKVWQEIDTYYVDETAVQNDSKLIYGSIKGLVDSLNDPYTIFMDPEETHQFEENLNASLEGIGAELTIEEGLLVVLSPLKDSPAEEAGLLPGDIIFQINGEVTSEMTLFDAIMSIRGEKGTDVTLTIIREEIAEPFDVTIVRDAINVESVTYELLEDSIGYISINQFSDDTGDEFNATLQKMILDDPKGLIIDLRYNGGGYLDIAVDILSELIEGSQVAVQIQTRENEENEQVYLWGNATLPELPLVILVNNSSASAAEIMAGTIQDYKRGLVIGEKTYGKGSVQEVLYLEDGSSLRMSIAHWLTPNGRNIENEGITPDRIVELTYEDALEGNDTQLEEATHYLLNL
ncbi:PDZ domain-containing protein [Candidatus Peregrinibacteria bacterium]|nr:PDZ domain-containing protein [Candidatus Peregrinibacteria bacterium]